jgi:hypothetical protein
MHPHLLLCQLAAGLMLLQPLLVLLPPLLAQLLQLPAPCCALLLEAQVGAVALVTAWWRLRG